MTVYIKDYLQYTENGDCTLAVQEALRVCKKQKAEKLLFEKGTYHFYGKYAYQKEYFMSNNDYSLKSIIFPLLGFAGLTVDGGGSDFIFHGEVLPFVVDGSREITIKNLSVDYPRPFFTQGKILASENGQTDIEFDQQAFPCRVEEDGILFIDPEGPEEVAPCRRMLIAEFDMKTGGPSAYLSPYIAKLGQGHKPHFLDHMTKFITAEQLSDSVIRLHGIDGHTPGNYWATTHARRDNPGVFLQDSQEVLLENIDLFHTQAMGVIGQLCHNVTLQNVNTVVRPGSGRMISVSADSTHFVNCSGYVRMFDCTFTNMLDDAGNFHGTYTTINKILDDHTLLLEFRHNQQKGVMLYRPGDIIHLVENASLAAYAALTVKEAVWHSGDFVRVETVEPLPREAVLGHAVENYSRMPDVHLRGCVSGHNRPRGFLVTTNGKVLIEDCTFYNMMCALHFTGDANDWFESGPVRDVTVRNNRFVNSAYTGGAVIAITPAVKVKEQNYYHSGITIENNFFELHEKRFLRVLNSRNVIFRNNTYRQNSALPAHDAMGQTGIVSAYCADCILEEPKSV